MIKIFKIISEIKITGGITPEKVVVKLKEIQILINPENLNTLAFGLEEWRKYKELEAINKKYFQSYSPAFTTSNISSSHLSNILNKLLSKKDLSNYYNELLDLENKLKKL